MARQRRGGGFRGPAELRGTLGTLLRSTLAQVGPLRDALERGAREGRSRVEEVLSNRRGGARHEALAELGEIVLDLIRRGEIDIDELPEVHDVVAHLDEVDRGHANEHDQDVAPPPVRKRFDARRRDEDDGTVAGATWAPPTRKRGDSAEPKVWRPPVDGPARPAAKPASTDDIATRPLPVTGRRKDPARKGGISFEDDDEDLAEYMHPDDVPAKGSGGSSDGDP